MSPHFLITIDVEGDNVWAKPSQVQTENAAYMPRFQALCEKYGVRPTYLTNHEMAMSPVYRKFAQDVAKRNVGEIGMHLHAWDTPPFEPLTADDSRHQPYLIDYPESTIRKKVRLMTDTLEQMVGTKMLSHRAGRWAFNATYAQALVDCGYVADCSVTPHISWRGKPGAPNGAGGSDYSRAPEEPYFIDLADVNRPGNSSLLEVPMTIVAPMKPVRSMVSGLPPRARAAVDRLLPPIQWLRPNGRNLDSMLEIIRSKKAAGATHIEFMLHSSEFMPGGSPTFKTKDAIERLYSDMEQVFAATQGLIPSTVSEFRAAFVSGAVH
ncbi:MAG TPA: hypothetical protein VM146_01340 [Steroidobacteraceae bacterium]|nr:hypothetical protein [Steroidobacteraceae bacterium]